MKYLGDGKWECDCGQVIDYTPIPVSPDPDADERCYECLPDNLRKQYDEFFSEPDK